MKGLPLLIREDKVLTIHQRFSSVCQATIHHEFGKRLMSHVRRSLKHSFRRPHFATPREFRT